MLVLRPRSAMKLATGIAADAPDAGLHAGK